jgi:hypothetical protein
MSGEVREGDILRRLAQIEEDGALSCPVGDRRGGGGGGGGGGGPPSPKFLGEVRCYCCMPFCA